MLIPIFVIVTCLLGSDPPNAPKFEPVTLRGKVKLLAAALKEAGIAADTDPIAQQVVLKLESGQLIPLLSDDASRAFFLDARLRDRKVEIRGNRAAILPYIQVVAFTVEYGGRQRIPEYYCDVCAISVRYPQTCPCCQGDMELRMRPDTP
jgi:hypothetical protein